MKATPWYFVCRGCNAKWFAPNAKHNCRRCGKECRAQEQISPPWRAFALSGKREASDTESEEGTVNTSFKRTRSQEAERLLETLTSKVRILSVEQVAMGFIPYADHPGEEAAKLVHALKKHDLVETHASVLHPLLPLTDGPVFRWTPGEAAPNFSRIAWQLRSRWKSLPKAMLICRATTKARELMRGTVGGRRARATELRHDLHVAEMYFHLQRTAPHLAATWIHEDTLLAQGLRHNDGRPIPDAVVGDGDVMEFGGSYKAEKLRVLHASYAHSPYTIW